MDEGATDRRSSMVNWEVEGWCLVPQCISKVVVFVLQTPLAAWSGASPNQKGTPEQGCEFYQFELCIYSDTKAHQTLDLWTCLCHDLRKIPLLKATGLRTVNFSTGMLLWTLNISACAYVFCWAERALPLMLLKYEEQLACSAWSVFVSFVQVSFVWLRKSCSWSWGITQASTQCWLGGLSLLLIRWPQ